MTNRTKLLLGATAGVLLLCAWAAGNIYYETLPGLVVKHPVTGVTTLTINGTNGNVNSSGTINGWTVDGIGNPSTAGTVSANGVSTASTNGLKPRLGTFPLFGDRWVQEIFRPGSALFLLREDYSTTQDAYWLGCETGISGVFQLFELRALTAGGLHALQNCELRTSCKMVDHKDASFVFTGANWGEIPQANSYGGSYTRTTTAGEYVTWTTTTACTAVGLRITLLSNMGFALVTIDGSATAANKLLSAQDYVTAGLLASSALVANGGTLNPTDKLIDQYYAGTAKDLDVELTSSLAAAVHTIVLTCTGYKESAAGGFRTSITGGFLRNGGPYNISSSDAYPCVISALDRISTDIGSAWEYAMQSLPTNATHLTYIGNTHGFETENALIIKTNGVATTLTNFQKVLPTTSISVTRVSALHHPDIAAGGTDIASALTHYSVYSSIGLSVKWSITNLLSGIVNPFYAAMLPVNPSYSMAGSVGAISDASLTNNNGSANLAFRSNAAYFWNPSGNDAIALLLPDMASSVNNWRLSHPRYLWFEDRVGGALKKLYVTRAYVDEYYEAGAVWSGSCFYTAQQFAGGANSELSR